MAGIVVLAVGWASLNGGAAMGSLSYAFLRFSPTHQMPQYSAMVNATFESAPTNGGETGGTIAKLWVVLGCLLLVNSLVAVWQKRRQSDESYGISAFPFANYALGLLLLGYGIAYSLSQWFFHLLNGDRSTTSRGMCSLYAFLCCLIPLPLSGPVALLYIPFILLFGLLN